MWKFRLRFGKCKKAESADTIRNLNERYCKVEQAELNYSWVNAWQSAYSCTLGFADYFSKISAYIALHAQTEETWRQQELEDAILYSCVRYADYKLEKMLAEKANPETAAFVDICAKYQTADGQMPRESIQHLESYLRERESRFRDYADDSVMVQGTYTFIRALEAFWRQAKTLLGSKNYAEYQALYTEFSESEACRCFLSGNA